MRKDHDAMATYGRAPIVEAVIELAFETPLSMKQVEKLRDKMRREYPAIKDRMNIAVHFDPIKGTVVNANKEGFQMNSTDGVDLVLLQVGSISASRLAPYLDWKNLSGRLNHLFESLVKLVGRIPVSRVSSRYINRFDIPDKQIVGQDVGNFFRFGVKSPDGVFVNCNSFSVTAVQTEAETGFESTVTCGSTENALIAHQSFILDIDVRTVGKVPVKPDEMWNMVDRLRVAKNNIFEGSITDQARKVIA